MNKSSYRKVNTVINVREVAWDLISQWKAILLVALLMMVVIAGLKYGRDYKAYKLNAEREAAKGESDLTAEEQIEAIISALPEDEQLTVEYLVRQDEWTSNEKEYIENSILLNTNPANQRTLLLDYYIKSTAETTSDITSLVYGYAGFVSNNEFTEAVRQAISPDADDRYIAELISTNNGNSNSVGTKTAFSSTDDNAAVMEIRIVLPEDCNANAVEEAATNAIKDYSSYLSGSIGAHSISLLKSGESYLYNADAVNIRNNILTSIYNLYNYSKNMTLSLTEGQQAAYEAIKTIKKERAIAETSADTAIDSVESFGVKETIPKPSISKKYALLGFMIGAFIYSFLYLLIIIIRGRINAAGDVEYYTQSRLLGEIYSQKEHKGLDALFHSKLVNKYRYKDKLDEEKQIHEFASAVEAVCKHAGTDGITVFCMSGLSDLKERALMAVRERGLDVKVTDISEQTDEEYMLDARDVVCMADKNSKADELIRVVGLIREYDVKQLGCIYTEAL